MMYKMMRQMVYNPDADDLSNSSDTSVHTEKRSGEKWQESSVNPERYKVLHIDEHNEECAVK